MKPSIPKGTRDFSPEELQKMCIKIFYQASYIIINAPVNKLFNYLPCNQDFEPIWENETGTKKNIQNIIEIGEKYYDIQTMQLIETIPAVDKFVVDEYTAFHLDNKTYISYGPKTNYNDYLKDKSIILQILSTFEFFESE